MILQVLERDKIDYDLPILTLDTGQIALKDLSRWPPEMNGLRQLEWNYFKIKNLELCVTPHVPIEITQGTEVGSLGSTAYNRFQKSQLFKSRPPGATLSLSEKESNTLWTGISDILWPTANELTANQIGDVNQIFFHTVASGSIAQAAFVTVDTNFHKHSDELKSTLGVTVFTPHQAWEEYQPRFNLYKPTEQEIMSLWREQQVYFRQLQLIADTE